jgi:hypothetical protein
LRRIRRRCAGQAPCRSARNPAPREALNLGLRFTQGSNINSVDESCGKLKALRSGDFSCGKTRFFRGDDVAAAFLAESPALAALHRINSYDLPPTKN